MAMPRQGHGSATAVPWQCHGNATAVPDADAGQEGFGSPRKSGSGRVKSSLRVEVPECPRSVSGPRQTNVNYNPVLYVLLFCLSVQQVFSKYQTSLWEGPKALPETSLILFEYLLDTLQKQNKNKPTFCQILLWTLFGTLGGPGTLQRHSWRDPRRRLFGDAMAFP